MSQLAFLNHVDNKPILILSMPRTGSTALASVISKNHNYVYYGDLFNSNKYDLAIIKNFWQDFQTNKKIMLKLSPQHLANLDADEFNLILTKSFVIYLQRLDCIAQIISYHVAVKTNKWVYNKTDLMQDNFSIDTDGLENNVKRIIKLRQESEKFKTLAEVSLVYEEIIDLLTDADCQKQIQPTNYDTLKIEVKQILNKLKKK